MGMLVNVSARRKPSNRMPKVAPRSRLTVEQLESRLVPSVSGDAWIHPNLVTISFVPDGTVVSSDANGPITSNLFATFNAKFGSPSVWENEILKAAQLWAQQANLNFTVVSDNGTASGGGNYQQGDPGMGDIRIGGYAFSTNSYLAGTFMPPPDNNYSVAGDMNFNTGQTFNINSTYDLQTVALHELGHAIGLSHSTDSNAVMWPSYTTQKRALGTDDITTVQSIYGVRNHDVYNSNGLSNGTMATAASLSSLLDPAALTAVVNPLDITTTSQKEYFSVVAPQNTSGTFTVSVQSTGLSLLRPTVKVYAADQTTILASATSGTVYNGATLTVTVNGVTAGAQYYIRVGGYDTTAFGTGAYALTLNLGSGASPTVSPPNTQVLDGSPLTGGGGVPMEAMMDMMEATYDPHFVSPHHHHGFVAPGSDQGAGDSHNAEGTGVGNHPFGSSSQPVAGTVGSPGHSVVSALDAWFISLVDLWGHKQDGALV